MQCLFCKQTSVQVLSNGSINNDSYIRKPSRMRLNNSESFYAFIVFGFVYVQIKNEKFVKEKWTTPLAIYTFQFVR